MLLYRRIRKFKWERIYQIHPYISKWKEMVDIYTTFMVLREHEDKFLIYI